MAERPSSSPAQKVAFDTDVLIWYFRGNEKARRFLGKVPYPQRALSSLTLMELIQGSRNREEAEQIISFTMDNIAVTLHPNEHISRRAISLLEQHSFSRGLRVIDALIAATAIETGCSLATGNSKHYHFIDRLHLIPFKP